MVNPEDYIITRKRKKYKFALFYNSEICFEFDEWGKKDIDVLEIGSGDGLFLVELATLNPDKKYLGVDVKGDRLQKGAYEATSRGLKNIFFVRARADQVEDLVDKNSVEDLWLTFSDPFPRKKSAGRRITHPNFLNRYKNVLKENGFIKLKHDNLDFFGWSVERLVENNFIIKEISFDLHDSDLSDEYKIQTSYEKRWLDEGRKTYFVRAGIK